MGPVTQVLDLITSKVHPGDFPDGPVIETSSSNVGDVGFDQPGSPVAKIPHVS